jgi:hypothetical protein
MGGKMNMHEAQKTGNVRHFRMIRGREPVESGVILVCFAIVVALLSYGGLAHRQYLYKPRVWRISAPDDAFLIWKDQSVRGRTLFLFDRDLNTEKELLLPEAYYVFAAINKRIIRKIYHIIPDVYWNDVSGPLRKNPLVASSGESFRMAIHEGVPVIVMRMKDIPRIKEKVLVSINAACWSDSERGQILQSLRAGTLDSDLVTISGQAGKRGTKEGPGCF